MRLKTLHQRSKRLLRGRITHYVSDGIRIGYYLISQTSGSILTRRFRRRRWRQRYGIRCGAELLLERPSLQDTTQNGRLAALDGRIAHVKQVIAPGRGETPPKLTGKAGSSQSQRTITSALAVAAAGAAACVLIVIVKTDATLETRTLIEIIVWWETKLKWLKRNWLSRRW